jgi:hypothetical protein
MIFQKALHKSFAVQKIIAVSGKLYRGVRCAVFLPPRLDTFASRFIDTFFRTRSPNDVLSLSKYTSLRVYRGAGAEKHSETGLEIDDRRRTRRSCTRSPGGVLSCAALSLSNVSKYVPKRSIYHYQKAIIHDAFRNVSRCPVLSTIPNPPPLPLLKRGRGDENRLRCAIFHTRLRQKSDISVEF